LKRPPRVVTYADEQEELKRSFLRGVADAESEEGEFSWPCLYAHCIRCRESRHWNLNFKFCLLETLYMRNYDPSDFPLRVCNASRSNFQLGYMNWRRWIFLVTYGWSLPKMHRKLSELNLGIIILLPWNNVLEELHYSLKFFSVCNVSKMNSYLGYMCG